MMLLGNINAIPFRRRFGGGGGTPFPSIPGMVARYSGAGLTNEEMSKNPVWKDLTGNGHDLQMKNFAWGGMSGVGGYKLNWSNSNTWANYIVEGAYGTGEITNNTIHITSAKTNNALFETRAILKSVEYKVLIKGLTDDIYLRYGVFNDGKELWTEIKNDGIYTLPSYDYDSRYNMKWKVMSQTYPIDCDITIEQLPLYPGFILGDGVDDFAVTEKELNFEDTYTVYTAFIPFQVDPVRAMEMCGKDFKKDFYLYYSNTHVVYYTSGLNNYIPVRINQFHIIVCKRNKTNAVIKNLITGESKTFSVSELIDNPGVYYLWRYQRSGTSTAKTAIAGQTICNGYFSTDEDDEKVLNWYKKQYPWLFPDQAWTVVGKTNEDEDRATIANITGNGNDLVLSNFGFAEGSGYGLYYQYFGNEFKATNGEIEGGGWNIIDNYNISHDKRIHINSIGKCFWGNKALVNGIKLRFKLTGMTEGDVLAFGYAATYNLTYTSDGIYAIDLPPVDKPYGFSLQSSLTENLPTTPVTIELLPFEYEGYLVTDGADDKITSSAFKIGKDWTVVGDWEIITQERVDAGIVKKFSLMVYSSVNGVTLFINDPNSSINIESKSLKAICSDGRVYLNDWTEVVSIAKKRETGSKSSLSIGFNGNNFLQMAFKNLGIYNGAILSKDDCIKAYNYLQTLKAK